MTREEAVNKAIIIVSYFEAHFAKSKEAREEAVNIIEVLEQEPVLDKIRAEITDWQTDIHDNEHDAETHDFVFERIYEIFDEYNAERKG